MAEFVYTARDRAGKTQTGNLTADSREDLTNLLRRQGLLPLEIREKRARQLSLPNLNPLANRSMTSADVEQALHQIAVLQRSGVTLLESVNLVAEFSRPSVRKIWEQIGRKVREGNSFADALAEHKAFDNLIVQLIRVGEHTGRLDLVLDQASVDLEQNRKLRAQLKSALLYPSFVLLFTIAIAAFLILKVMPEIKKLMSIMGGKMPPVTQALLDVSNWVTAHGLVIVIGMLATVASFLVIYRWAPARLFVDTHALRLPVLGTVFRLSGTVLFARTLGLMLRSGVLIVDALRVVEQVHYNRHLANNVAYARASVMEGSTLAEPLAARFGYMPLLARMIVIGENAGSLDEMLQEMANFHDELLQKAIKRLAGLVAPFMTVVVGGMIGFVYAAFLVAMFSAAGGSPK